jgi:hypothetical protein
MRSGLLSLDKFAVGAMACVGMQDAINCIQQLCDEWQLKINTARAKKRVTIFMKKRILGKNKKWKIMGQEIETKSEISI